MLHVYIDVSTAERLGQMLMCLMDTMVQWLYVATLMINVISSCHANLPYLPRYQA